MFVQSVVRARSEVEAAWLVFEGKPGTRLIAGGTDLMLQISRGRKQASALVDLRRSGMDRIVESDDAIRIGAATSVSAIACHEGIRQHFNDLHQAATSLASPQIRNMATLGGNIGNASPAADLVSPLMAHEARLLLRRGDDVRDIGVNSFFTGPGQTVMSDQDLLTEIVLPKPRPRAGKTYCHFYKLGFRGAQIIAVVNMAINLQVRKGMVETARIAYGAVAPTIVRASSAEKVLCSAQLNDDTIRAAAQAVRNDIAPIDDIRAPAAYRARVACNYLRLALEQTAAQAQSEA